MNRWATRGDQHARRRWTAHARNDLSHPKFNIGVEMSFSRVNPPRVLMTLHPVDGQESITWRISREQLRHGVDDITGVGDIVIYPVWRGDDVGTPSEVELKLTGECRDRDRDHYDHDLSLYVTLRRADVLEFLTRTYALVSPAAEQRFLRQVVERELRDILGDA